MLLPLVHELNSRRPRLRKYRNYYLGKQKFQFAGAALQSEYGEKLQHLSCNRCSTVIDSVVDRLSIEGFEDLDAEGNHEELAEQFWNEHDMDSVAREVHQEALIHGDAFVLVWPNEKVEMFAQNSDQIAVIYDDEYPDRMHCAAKAWKLRDGKWRINLYFADRLEKYKSIRADTDLPDSQAVWEPYSDEGDASWPIRYDFGRVPVFHFKVNARAGEYGHSDLASIIPLQDRLNESLANQAIAEEYQSYPQRWATGLQPITVTDPETGEEVEVLPFQPGADRVWTSTSENTKFGSFEAANLVQFEEVIKGHELRIANTAHLPVHFLTGLGAAPSGEALKTAEAPFVAKVKDRQRSFGATWNQLLRFVLFLEHNIVCRIEVQWMSAESRMPRKELAETALVLEAAGVSQAQVLRELGYTNDQIDEFADEKEAEGEDLARAFNGE